MDTADNDGDRPAAALSFERVEQITKSSAALLALIYGLGLMISMQHLIALGISDFSSIKPKYIVTGTWTAMLLFVATIPLALPVSIWMRLSLKERKQKRMLIIVPAAILSGAFTALWGESLFINVLSGEHTSLLSRGNIGLTVSVSVISVFFGSMWIDSRRSSGLRMAVLIATTIALPSGIFVIARDFIQPIYIRVPEALGGARPRTGELILNRDGVGLWKQAGLTVAGNAGSTQTLPVKILYQSDQELVISATYQDGANRREKIVILKRALVDGILPSSN